jgi:hypothetical protein
MRRIGKERLNDLKSERKSFDESGMKLCILVVHPLARQWSDAIFLGT